MEETPSTLSFATTTEERQTALRAFDSTKTGVKGLVESGITTLPSIFIFPSLPFTSSSPPPAHLSIPTVDLSLPDHLLLPSLISAAHHWGFFQLINHSISLDLIHRTIAAVRSFHSLPPDARSVYYNRSAASAVSYFSNLDLFQSSAAYWKDILKVENCSAVVEKVPEVCREELVEWDAAAAELASKVTALLLKGIGVAEDRVEKMGFLEKRILACNCYPPCPSPKKTMGAVEHTDSDLLTVLIQDELGGLQVKKERGDGRVWWVDVPPVPGAILVNIGNLFQARLIFMKSFRIFI